MIKIKKLFLYFILILTLTGCSDKKQNESEELKQESNLEVKVKENCNNEISEYYTSEDNRKLYLVCLNEVNIKDEGSSLASFLSLQSSNFDNKLDELTKNITHKEYLKDGGTTIYKDKELTIIRCNRMDENTNINKDVYIGSNNLEMQEQFCK